MKEIDFIGSENVVNIASLGRIIIIDERTNYNNGFILATSISIKTDFNSKNNDSAHLSVSIFKNFETIVMQSYLTNSSKISYAKKISTRINN